MKSLEDLPKNKIFSLLSDLEKCKRIFLIIQEQIDYKEGKILHLEQLIKEKNVEAKEVKYKASVELANALNTLKSFGEEHEILLKQKESLEFKVCELEFAQTLEADLIKLREAKENLINNQTLLENKISILTEDLARKTSEFETIQGEFESLKNEKLSLLKSFEDNEKHAADLKILMEEKEMIICALKEKIQLSEIDKTRKGALETKQTELLKDETIFNSAVIFSQLQAAIVELKTSFSQNGICDSTLFLSMDNYCSVLKEHLLKLQGKCTYLEDLLSQGNDEREALEISLATLQSQYDVRAWTSLEMEKKFLEFQRSYELTTEKLNEELTVAETIIKEKNLEVRKLQEQRENIEDFFKIVNEKNSNNEERLREAEATLERCSSLQEEKNEIKFLLEKINEQETLLGAVESLSEQLEKLKEMLETKDRECGALNHQLLEAEFRISSLDSLLETKSNEFIRLQTEVEGKNALKHENKNLHEQLAGALAREDESNKKLDQLKFEVCSKQSAFEAAEKDLYDLNLKLSLANQLADKKTEEANKLLETINIYKKLDEELIKKNEIICNLEQRCSDSKVEYDHLKSLLSDTLQELEKYHAANESISIKHENLQQEYTILQETVDENAQQLLLAEEKLKELQSQYDTAKAERFSLYSELERLKEVEALCNASKCATFCKRLNDLQTAENALKESLSAKEAEVIGYSTEVMEMKKELKQSYEKLETLKAEMEKVVNQRDSFFIEITESTSRLSQAKILRDNLELQKDELQKLTQRLKEELLQEQEKYSESIKVNRKLESAITDLNCANKESETFIENLKERFEDLKSKEERLARKVEELENNSAKAKDAALIKEEEYEEKYMELIGKVKRLEKLNITMKAKLRRETGVNRQINKVSLGRSEFNSTTAEEKFEFYNNKRFYREANKENLSKKIENAPVQLKSNSSLFSSGSTRPNKSENSLKK